MGLLDNYTGIGMAPRPAFQHQLAMQKLLVYLVNNTDDEEFICLSEAALDERTKGEIAPDIVIFEAETLQPVVIIEICKTNDIAKITIKISEVLKQYQTIIEAFIYDYEKKNFVNITNPKDDDFCHTTGDYLSEAFD